jgi:diaminohydroxyphosphoribosylaminopyrimidine deaminase/5-amino-6-(5-phosphoribosylamino)uracil reductase
VDDQQYMRRCLALAAQAEGRTSPNPLVGAVVVADDGTIIAEGFHQKAGEPHAEVLALDRAGDRARGQTLYVNLEPCCHHGKTPPCSERVIASGVRRVVFGMLDPNPKVAGGGKRALESAGIETCAPLLEAECRKLNRAFLSWIEQRRPWVCLKIAATIDGYIADRHGSSRWITSENARRYVHEIRDKHDVVMVGAGTIRADDPELTVRDVSNGRNPVRAILSSGLNIDPQARICQIDDGKTWIFATEQAISQSGKLFNDKRVRLIAAPQVSDGVLDAQWILSFFGEQRLISVLCEGGGRLAGHLLECGLVDELQWLVAPKLLGDPLAVAAVDRKTEVKLADAITFTDHHFTTIDPDLLIRAFLRTP